MDLSLNFDDMKFDLKKISEGRILSQYSDSVLYKLLLGAITAEVQELLDAINDLMEYRTIAKARGKILDIIGNIVGAKRSIISLDPYFWFMPDNADTLVDNAKAWVVNGQQSGASEMDDDQFRKFIWLKILKNNNKFSSKQEIEKQILDGINEKVGIQRVGMINQDIYVSPGTSSENKGLLQASINTTLTDNQYNFSYPATTNVLDVIEE